MSTSISTVTSIDGVFYAKQADGSLRELHNGDDIYAGEQVLGADTNSEIGSIILHMQDGTDIVLLGHDKQLFDTSLSMESFSRDETVSDVESIVAIANDDEEDKNL